mmetsp:Transcript_54493/g.138214  ORF Transcript_54493/g.138214 Transcript_54493/m.138214 type:complete len:83 (-) Transcript_54493:116-364(-)
MAASAREGAPIEVMEVLPAVAALRHRHFHQQCPKGTARCRCRLAGWPFFTLATKVKLSTPSTSVALLAANSQPSRLFPLNSP